MLSLAVAIAVGVHRRLDPEPHALRVPGAVAEGAGLWRTGHDDARVACGCRASRSRAGVVLTFVALAGAAAGAARRRRAARLGLPAAVAGVVIALAMLFFVLALNLSGVFEFASLVPSSAADWTAKNPYVDRVLLRRARRRHRVAVHRAVHGRRAGIRAGAARGRRRSAIFVALGVGMALPYVLLAWFPGWRRRLPRPGAWMERFKQVLAFPLYATVAWLAWVLGAQGDNDAVVRLLVDAGRARASRCGRGGSCARAARGRGASRRPSSVALVSAAVVAWPLLRGEPMRRARRPSPATRATGRGMPFTPAHGGGADAAAAARCSSTSPRHGASRAR